ncbi:hypothetical protein EYF80_060914 [Liparis tanakae]|uniref:Uncharacterized protein n=1 Tax=Liparis tanakae TaxID=230148 RepID=A0A4Z2EJJ0_9TELE|nr:hypothetical protein EYF80_060914 [Liparis tanakae]
MVQTVALSVGELASSNGTGLPLQAWFGAGSNKAAQTGPHNAITANQHSCWCPGQGKGHGCAKRKVVGARGTVNMLHCH